MKKNVTFQFIQVTILIFVAFGTVSEAGISLPTFYNSVKVAIKKNDLSKLEKKLSYAERDRYLVKNLSSPLKDGETLLTYAIKNSNYQISEAFISKKLLINVPNLIGETPLIIAINQKKYHLVNELLKVGVNVLQEERSDLLRFALCTNNFKVIDDLKFSPDEFNATDADGNNAMMFALINNCNPSFISRYLNLFKIDVNQVNQNQQSFFGLVLETKSKELIDASIKLGADINLPSKFATVEKEPILLPMMYGILDDDFNLIRKISQHDFFDIDAVDESTHKTYLNFAAELGRANIVDFLIYNQCDINKPDKNGNTPYINACKNGHLNIIEKLKISGADINFVNFLDKRDGLSYLIEKGEFERYLKMLDEFSQVSEDYLYYAVKGGAHDIAKHLIDSGVDPNKEGAFITEDHDMDGTDFPDLSEAINYSPI